MVAILLLNLGCDQVSKNVARKHISSGEVIPLIPDYLTLTKVENAGAFLSLGNDLSSSLKTPLLILIPSFILVGIMVVFMRNKKLDLNYGVPLACIVGGGIGNLYDRILHGSVTDFVHMNFGLFQTGIFNMADVSIMIGAFWILCIQLTTKNGNTLVS